MGQLILLVMIGLPRSGKTTMAARIGRWLGAQIVSPDAIRLALHGERFNKAAESTVWYLAEMMVRSLANTGYGHIILDATNTTQARRQMWWGRADMDTYFLRVDTPADECIRRARGQCDHEIVPIIERMAANQEPLTDEQAEYLVTEQQVYKKWALVPMPENPLEAS